MIEKEEEILITYRGKARAKLTPPDTPSPSQTTDDAAFGMWCDREEDVEQMVRKMRQGRDFGL